MSALLGVLGKMLWGNLPVDRAEKKPWRGHNDSSNVGSKKKDIFGR